MAIADIFSTPQLFLFDARAPAVIAATGDVPLHDFSDVLEVDVTISEQVVHGYEVSSNPVERGINVADHKRAKAVVLRMSGIVSDSPNNALDVLSGNLSGTLGASRDDSGNETNTRSQDAYERLVALSARTDPIRVVCSRGEFKSMTFTDFDVKKDDAGHYIGFSATLEEVRFAEPSFGTFAVEVEHTAPAKAEALKEPEVLDKKSMIRASEEGGDAAIEATSGSVLDKGAAMIKGAWEKGRNIKK